MSLDIDLVQTMPTSVYSANVTHNLAGMAREAGLYQCLWHPGDVGVTHARQLIEPLRAAIVAMLADPERFRRYNPANGWGDYEGFLAFCRRLADACEEYPDAEVEASG